MTRSTLDSGYQDLEELRVRLAEFRSAHQPRTRLPEELWRAAAEIAAQRGMKITARLLHLDRNSLTKWMDKEAGETQRPAEPKRAKRKYTRTRAAVMETPANVSGTAGSLSGQCCQLHRGSSGGKLRMELKGLGASEIAQLLHTFAGR
jgi:hypothetical protein